MDEEKRVFDSEKMTQPALLTVIGNVPSPDPDGRNRSIQLMRDSNREFKGTVKRIIAHLEKD
jgi:hypothetical protein